MSPVVLIIIATTISWTIQSTSAVTSYWSLSSIVFCLCLRGNGRIPLSNATTNSRSFRSLETNLFFWTKKKETDKVVVVVGGVRLVHGQIAIARNRHGGYWFCLLLSFQPDHKKKSRVLKREGNEMYNIYHGLARQRKIVAVMAKHTTRVAFSKERPCRLLFDKHIERVISKKKNKQTSVLIELWEAKWMWIVLCSRSIPNTVEEVVLGLSWAVFGVLLDPCEGEGVDGGTGGGGGEDVVENVRLDLLDIGLDASELQPDPADELDDMLVFGEWRLRWRKAVFTFSVRLEGADERWISWCTSSVMGNTKKKKYGLTDTVVSVTWCWLFFSLNYTIVQKILIRCGTCSHGDCGIIWILKNQFAKIRKSFLSVFFSPSAIHMSAAKTTTTHTTVSPMDRSEDEQREGNSQAIVIDDDAHEHKVPESKSKSMCVAVCSVRGGWFFMPLVWYKGKSKKTSKRNKKTVENEQESVSSPKKRKTDAITEEHQPGAGAGLEEPKPVVAVENASSVSISSSSSSSVKSPTLPSMMFPPLYKRMKDRVDFEKMLSKMLTDIQHVRCECCEVRLSQVIVCSFHLIHDTTVLQLMLQPTTVVVDHESVVFPKSRFTDFVLVVLHKQQSTKASSSLSSPSSASSSSSHTQDGSQSDRVCRTRLHLSCFALNNIQSPVINNEWLQQSCSSSSNDRPLLSSSSPSSENKGRAETPFEVQVMVYKPLRQWLFVCLVKNTQQNVFVRCVILKLEITNRFSQSCLCTVTRQVGHERKKERERECQ